MEVASNRPALSIRTEFLTGMIPDKSFRLHIKNRKRSTYVHYLNSWYSLPVDFAFHCCTHIDGPELYNQCNNGSLFNRLSGGQR
jgi:hypothetical protein